MLRLIFGPALELSSLGVRIEETVRGSGLGGRMVGSYVEDLRFEI